MAIASAVVAVTERRLELYTNVGSWTARAFVMSLCFAAAAAVVLQGGGRRGLGRVLTVTAVAFSAYGMGGVLFYAARNGGWHLPPPLLSLFRGTATMTMFGCLAVLPLWFPHGRLEHRYWRRIIVSMAVALSLYLAPVFWYGRGVTNVTWMADAAAKEHVWWEAYGYVVIWVPRIVAVAVLIDLLRRQRAANGLVRRQLTAMGVGFAVYWAVQILYQLLEKSAGQKLAEWLLYLLNAPAALSLALISIATVYREDLTTFDRFLRRSLIGVGLIVGLSSAYYGMFLGLSRLLTLRADVSAAIASALGVLALRPAAGLLWRAGDLLLYGRRAKPYEMLRALADSLSHRIPADDVPVVLCGTVVQRLGLPTAVLTAHTRSGNQVLARTGAVDRPEAVTVHLDLVDRGELVGVLSVQLRPGQRTLDANDRAALGVVTDQLGPIVSAIGLREELRISRERVVSACEEERRRLRRDLHDGLGPTLAGMRLQLDAAAIALTPSSRPRTLVESASIEAARSLDEVRRIIDDLRPPVLDDRGLSAALTSLAARFDTGALSTAAAVPDTLPELPAASETAAYRIAAEALANVVRHAGATTAHLVLAVDREQDQLVLEITDDGCGLPERPRREGVGLASMAERAEEIGGHCTVSPPTDGSTGTVVRALLPLHLD
ncbi:sensor histidine kinase [Streptomyces dioscori]|uniref:sensor histidine kinase n=1 Tax=Streptomyces dioscori TaxID=2109333 RepID=UPI00131B5682|nr:histidine kinase [Streptomyces dioscori]